jgi:hypothetical protein
MPDVFSGAGGLGVRRRLSSKSNAFNPSFGVRKGLLADGDKVAEGAEGNRRKSRRWPLSFEVAVAGRRMRVAGDLSAGGAMVLLPTEVAVPEMTLFVKDPSTGTEHSATGKVVSVRRRGARFAHGVAFGETAAFAAMLERLATPVGC